MNAGQDVVVVTGGNKGIGYETCRQLARDGLRVVLTSRDVTRGRGAVSMLESEGLKLEYHELDVTSAQSAAVLAAWLEDRYGRIDALVNNAAVLLEPEKGKSPSALETAIDTMRTTLEVNTIGTMQVTMALLPLIRKSKHGRIVNVSSGWGQLATMEGGRAGYRMSKAALNAMTRVLASELKSAGIRVNSVCPGWVRTDMGGRDAQRTPEEGSDTIVWLAKGKESGPNGSFYRDRKTIAW